MFYRTPFLFSRRGQLRVLLGSFMYKLIPSDKQVLDDIYG